MEDSSSDGQQAWSVWPEVAEMALDDVQGALTPARRTTRGAGQWRR